MIHNFKINKSKTAISWKYKEETKTVEINNIKIAKAYDFIEKIFVISLDEKLIPMLSIYDCTGELFDTVKSTSDCIICGIRKGVICVEILVKSKTDVPRIYFYDIKKRRLVKTDETV